MEEQIQGIRDLDAEEVDLSTKSTSCTQNIKKNLMLKKLILALNQETTQVLFSSSTFSSSSSASSSTSLPLLYYSDYSFIDQIKVYDIPT